MNDTSFELRCVCCPVSRPASMEKLNRDTREPLRNRLPDGVVVLRELLLAADNKHTKRRGCWLFTVSASAIELLKLGRQCVNSRSQSINGGCSCAAIAL